MNDAQMREFRSLSKGVRLPDEVRARVTAEAEGTQARQPCERARMVGGVERGRHRPIARELTRGLPGPRQVALRAAAVLALAVVLLAGSAFAGGPVADALLGTGNYFALKAYAEGSRTGDAAGDVRLASQGFNGILSYGGGLIDHTTHTVSGQLRASQMFRLSVEGNNIAQVTYTIEGDGLRFHAMKNRSANGDGTYEEETGTSFTVAYDEQAADWDKFTRTIEQTIPITGEVEEAMNHAVAVADSQWSSWHWWEEDQDQRTDEERRLSHEASAHEYAVISNVFAQNLAKGRIVMTVTFNDGSTQSKAYTFTPVDDYMARHKEFMLKLYELSDDATLTDEERNAKSDELYTEMPQMFTVTETQL